jgi:uncharacterized protein (TIGR01777 family)
MLGSALREALITRNSSILQLVRSAPTAPNQLQWNPASSPAIPHTDALESLTAAVHFSGASLSTRRWTDDYKQEIIESRVASTRALANTLAGLENPPLALLVASAIGIYGNRGDELIDETSTPGQGFLAETCQQWEAAAQPAVAAGIRVLHLRFGVILGSGSGALGKMLPFFRLCLGGKLGSGNQYMSWISLPDAIAGILFLLDAPSLAGPFNFSAPNPVTNAQFTRALAQQLHRPAIFNVPAFALRVAFGEMADEALLSSCRAYPARLAAAGFQFTHASIVHALPAVLAPHRI